MVGMVQSRHANEMEVTMFPSRTIYAFDNESRLGGEAHAMAYVEAFVRVREWLFYALGARCKLHFGEDILPPSSGLEEVKNFAKNIYWNKKDTVKLDILEKGLVLICNSDPIVFVIQGVNEADP